ncbi:unnamed protein product [Cyclocybe aegerita]|uniref:Uncharacterized protein n=1 Tax=Cyclocybe aegerita TaxID=1973307 RepID=A0A8S0VUV7_CYCAE|nr:unnamed protein product [Cyclocybe aegerita]
MDFLPSYESIFSDVQKHITHTSGKTMQEVLVGADALVGHPIKSILETIPEVIATVGIKGATPPLLDVLKDTTSWSSDFDIRPYTTAATDAVVSCHRTVTDFQSLEEAFRSLNSKVRSSQTESFAVQLGKLHGEFINSVQKSGKLADEIADYGHRFENRIVPLCNNLNPTPKEIEAEKFTHSTNILIEELDRLKNTFGVFTGGFLSWAETNEDQYSAESEKIQRKIDSAQERLENYLSVPPVVLMKIKMPFGFPFLDNEQKMEAMKRSCRDEIEDESKKLRTVNDIIDSIQQVRDGLTNLQNGHLAKFKQNITAIVVFWRMVHNDALLIGSWIEDSAKDTDMPEYMRTSVEGAVNICGFIFE